MKVAFFIARADTIGGSQRHVLDLAYHLNLVGHEVVVITGPRGPYSKALEEHGVSTIEICSLSSSLISPLNDLKALSQLLKVLTDFKPQVLTLHSTKSGVLGRIAAKRLNIPCVYTLHGVAFGPSVALPQRCIALIAEICLRPYTNHVIAVSEFDRHQAISCLVVNPKKITEIRNGLPDKKIQQNVGGVDRSVTNIVMVARFAVPKRHDLVVSALAKLPPSRRWSVKMVGDGPGESDIKAMVRELKLCNRVSFMGLVEDSTRIIDESDVLILISDREGLPIAIGEALRAGRPVIASNVGGISEIVSESSGWLVAPRNEKQLISALLAATDSDTNLRLMGEAARESYEQKLGYDYFLARTLAIYEAVV